MRSSKQSGAHRRSQTLAILVMALAAGLGVVLLGNYWSASAAPAAGAAYAPDAPSAPDSFGYYWMTDTYPADAWDDLSSTQPYTFSEPNGFVLVDPIGFQFPFYEYSYPQLFIRDNGLVVFQNREDLGSERMPLEPIPNGLIAGFWDDLSVGYNNAGKLFYKPYSDHLVIEWLNVSSLSVPTNTLSFEMKLWATGNIEILYKDVNVSGETAAVGIEDSEGGDGLEYMFRQPNRVKSGLRVTFLRPPSSNPRVKLSPNYLSGWLINRQVVFKLQVKNTSTGLDTYDFLHSFDSQWSVSFFESDGRTPLGNTNGNEFPDTGSMAPGAVKNIVVLIKSIVPRAPGFFSDLFILSAKSSNGSRPSDITRLRIAVPYPFVTAYYDGVGNKQAFLDLVWANNEFDTSMQEPFARGDNLAITRNLANKGYVYVWDNRNVPDPGNPEYLYREVRLILANKFGGITRSATVIEDHSAGNVSDSLPSVATTPNGRIGVVYKTKYGNNENVNIRFAILDSLGNFVVGVQSVTQISGLYDAPVVIGTSNNTFVVVWTKQNANLEMEIWGVLFDANGGKKNEALIAAGAGIDFKEPALTTLSDGRVLLSYIHSTAQNVNTIRYRVGNIIQTTLTWGNENELIGVEGSDPTAIELKNGEKLMAWISKDLRAVSYALLTNIDNPASAVIFQPLRTLDNRQVRNISLAADPSGNGILSWMDDRYHDFIYCAVVKRDGAVAIAPIAYLGSGITSDLFSSFVGLGIASYDGAFRVQLPFIRR